MFNFLRELVGKVGNVIDIMEAEVLVDEFGEAWLCEDEVGEAVGGGYVDLCLLESVICISLPVFLVLDGPVAKTFALKILADAKGFVVLDSIDICKNLYRSI